MDVAEMTDGATAGQVAPHQSGKQNRRSRAAENGKAELTAAATAELLSADAILSAQDVIYEVVDCRPVWPGSIRMRGLQATERDDYEISCMKQLPGGGQRLNLSGARARLVAKCAVDGAGNRLFSDEQAAVLGQKNAKMLDKLFDVARRLSGLTKDDIEAIVGNLKDGPSAVSA